MSVIIALRAKDGLSTWVGSDTMITGGTLRQHFGPKWLLRGPWAIGVAGHLRTVNLVEHNLDALVLDLKDPHDFALRMREAMKSDGYNGNTDEVGPLAFGGAIILASAAGAWVIGSDFSITPIAPGSAWSEGSGRELTIGAAHALLSLSPSLAPEDIVARALGAAMALDLNCGGQSWIRQLD